MNYSMMKIVELLYKVFIEIVTEILEYIISSFISLNPWQIKKKYNIQRNFCKKLLRTTKKEYFNNLDTKKVTDNKTFWRTVVPTFSSKNSKSDKIILNEEGKTVSDEK